jgi:hypothetical protein
MSTTAPLTDESPFTYIPHPWFFKKTFKSKVESAMFATDVFFKTGLTPVLLNLMGTFWKEVMDSHFFEDYFKPKSFYEVGKLSFTQVMQMKRRIYVNNFSHECKAYIEKHCDLIVKDIFTF